MNFVISAILWQFQVSISPSFFTENKWKSYKMEFKLLIMTSKNSMLIGWKLAILLSSEIRIKLNVHKNNSFFLLFIVLFSISLYRPINWIRSWWHGKQNNILASTEIEFDFSNYYSNYKSSQVAPIAKCPAKYPYQYQVILLLGKCEITKRGDIIDQNPKLGMTDRLKVRRASFNNTQK